MCGRRAGDTQNGFSADVETGPLRFDDGPDVKGKEELTAKCGSWPEKQRGGGTSEIRSPFVSERRRTEDLLFLGAVKRPLFCRHSN